MKDKELEKLIKRLEKELNRNLVDETKEEVKKQYGIIKIEKNENSESGSVIVKGSMPMIHCLLGNLFTDLNDKKLMSYDELISFIKFIKD